MSVYEAVHNTRLFGLTGPLSLPPAAHIMDIMAFGDERWTALEQIVIAIDCGTTRSKHLDILLPMSRVVARLMGLTC